MQTLNPISWDSTLTSRFVDETKEIMDRTNCDVNTADLYLAFKIIFSEKTRTRCRRTPELDCEYLKVFKAWTRTVLRHLLATWPSGIARRWQILRDGFDSRLEPIAYDIFTGWLLTRRAQAHFAVSLNNCWILSLINCNLKVTSVGAPQHHACLLPWFER